MSDLSSTLSRPQLRILFDETIRRGIFRPVVRHLPADVADDRMQDALGIVWEMFERYATEKGQMLPDSILVHSCRQRAVERSRHYVPCEGAPRQNCVLDPRNYTDGSLEVLHLDGALGPDEDSREGDRELLGLAVAMCPSPARKIISQIDLDAWLTGLASRDRRLLAMRAAGCTLAEIGTELDLSTSQVWSRCMALGAELAQRAGVVTGSRAQQPTRPASA